VNNFTVRLISMQLYIEKFYCKKCGKFYLNRTQKISPENPLPRYRQKTKISLSYDVSDHVYSKSKSVSLYGFSQNRNYTDFDIS